MRTLQENITSLCGSFIVMWAVNYIQNVRLRILLSCVLLKLSGFNKLKCIMIQPKILENIIDGKCNVNSVVTTWLIHQNSLLDGFMLILGSWDERSLIEDLAIALMTVHAIVMIHTALNLCCLSKSPIQHLADNIRVKGWKQGELVEDDMIWFEFEITGLRGRPLEHDDNCVWC